MPFFAHCRLCNRPFVKSSSEHEYCSTACRRICWAIKAKLFPNEVEDETTYMPAGSKSVTLWWLREDFEAINAVADEAQVDVAELLRSYLDVHVVAFRKRHESVSEA